MAAGINDVCLIHYNMLSLCLITLELMLCSSYFMFAC